MMLLETRDHRNWKPPGNQISNILLQVPLAELPAVPILTRAEGTKCNLASFWLSVVIIFLNKIAPKLKCNCPPLSLLPPSLAVIFLKKFLYWLEIWKVLPSPLTSSSHSVWLRHCYTQTRSQGSSVCTRILPIPFLTASLKEHPAHISAELLNPPRLR